MSDAMPPFAERVVREQIRFAGRVFRVLESHVEVRPGRVEPFEFVEKPVPSVAVLPAYADGRLIFVREYCAAVAERRYGMVKGGVENGESAEQAALREMAEEAGVSGELTPLGVLEISPGYVRQRTTVFLARNLHDCAAEADERAHLSRVVISYQAAVALAQRGQITDARLLAALLLAQPYLNGTRR